MKPFNAWLTDLTNEFRHREEAESSNLSAVGIPYKNREPDQLPSNMYFIGESDPILIVTCQDCGRDFVVCDYNIESGSDVAADEYFEFHCGSNPRCCP